VILNKVLSRRTQRPIFFQALAFFFITVLTASKVYAASEQSKASPPIKPVGPLNSGDGVVYAPGKIGFIIKYTHFNQDQYYQGRDKVSHTRPQAGQTPAKKCVERAFNKAELTIRYGFWDDFDARLIVPYFNKEMEGGLTRTAVK
jgi:hypothetical protein